jgi:hypothetical protein
MPLLGAPAAGVAFALAFAHVVAFQNWYAAIPQADTGMNGFIKMFFYGAI